MLISHRRRFIYTKTVKTAGTSVEAYFEPWCLPEGAWTFAHQRPQHVSAEGIVGQRGPGASQAEWYNHMPAHRIRDKVGAETWDAYFKFCVVRDPYDKLVSWYWFQREKGKVAPDDDAVAGFRELLAAGVPVPDREMYVIDGQFCLDYAIRFEALHEGVAEVCNRLGLAFDPARLPRLKQGLRDESLSLADYYTPELARRVAAAYAFELDRFGYRPPAA